MDWLRRKWSNEEGKASNLHKEQGPLFELLVVLCLRLPNKQKNETDDVTAALVLLLLMLLLKFNPRLPFQAAPHLTPAGPSCWPRGKLSSLPVPPAFAKKLEIGSIAFQLEQIEKRTKTEQIQSKHKAKQTQTYR
jgi:hypothetical protein